MAARKKAPEPAPAREFNLHWNLDQWLGTKFVDTWFEVGEEMFAFTADRIREDIKTQHEILHCKSPMDLQKVQAGYVKKALSDYRNHSGRLVELGGQLGIPAS